MGVGGWGVVVHTQERVCDHTGCGTCLYLCATMCVGVRATVHICAHAQQHWSGGVALSLLVMPGLPPSDVQCRAP